MSSESANLGDVKQIYLEPFDQGQRALLVFEVNRPIHIGPGKTNYAGAILEERQLLQLFDGLAKLAMVRKAAMPVERIIKPTFRV